MPLLLNEIRAMHVLFISLNMEDENFFQKSATLVVSGIEIELQPTWPIFEKCSH